VAIANALQLAMRPPDVVPGVLDYFGKCTAHSGAGSGMASMAAAIPIWNLVWGRHTDLLKFGQLIFRNLIKIVATRCPI